MKIEVQGEERSKARRRQTDEYVELTGKLRAEVDSKKLDRKIKDKFGSYRRGEDVETFEGRSVYSMWGGA